MKASTARSIQHIASQHPADWRSELAPVYQTRAILSAAPLEGAGFFNCVAYIVEGHWMSLAVVFVILAVMAITFPSQSRFESWVEQVQRDHS